MAQHPATQLHIPESLRQKILEFRRRLWTIKLLEAVAGAAIGVLVGYLLVYAIDRVVDTPRVARWMIFGGAIVTCALIPLALERWVWRRRRLDQLALLLSKTQPTIGDQLLGIIELADSTSEQQRSPELVRAAIEQVSQAAEKRDFSGAVPRPRHKQRALTAGLLAAAAIALLVMTAAAARNAWARFLAPWGDTPRYTFAAIEPLPEKLIVPHGEPVDLPIRLRGDAEWRPDSASVHLGSQGELTAPLTNGGYEFALPGQLSPGKFSLRVGDYSAELPVEPMHRPELTGLSARIQLPDYLERTKPLERDIRGGTLSIVKGSQAEFTATISRPLTAAAVGSDKREPSGDKFSTAAVPVNDAARLALDWTDLHGLGPAEPFGLAIIGTDDEAPSVICENLPRQRVLLDSEILSFTVRARDDFGVRRVGIEWEGLDKKFTNPAQGETLLGAGGSEADFLELAATFSAKSLGIEPQPVGVRVFVEDYLPGRERVYSPVCIFEILNAEDHAIWVTAMLSRWQRMSLDVRDRELQLHETNKALRELSAEELDQPETRQQIEQQAAAERANGRRLGGLVQSGEELLAQAMRNPEIGVGHLDRWAEMMQILKDISGNRMPSVADLLKEGANAPQVAQKSPSNNAPKAGQNRANVAGTNPAENKDEPRPPTQVPTISDVESTHHKPENGAPQDPQEKKPSTPTLRLPSTMLAGTGKPKPGDKPPASEKVDEAVEAQADLLAEFEKVADELNELLANLEGSTLVKRLKAASRKQQQVSSSLASVAADSFGVPPRSRRDLAAPFEELAETEYKSSQEASYIMDDMAAYFDRSRYTRFKVVLDDMRKQDVTAGLRSLGDDLKSGERSGDRPGGVLERELRPLGRRSG
ncbi:MAG: hypothetical protein R3B90_20825 [Planctomycetaceae bacterium]